MCALVLSVFVMIRALYKYPRQYLNAPFEENAKILLGAAHVHYLKNVLRKSVGDCIRVFNGVDGEWVARLETLSKRGGEVILVECIKVQTAPVAPVHLFFSPIKKQRMDVLIEKAVELGVTDLHPVIMNRTENRKINKDRLEAQIIEAAEQCERLNLPNLHEVQKLSAGFGGVDVPIFIAMERENGAKPISLYDYSKGAGFVIGPEGGFDESECALLRNNEEWRFVSLGEGILRAETAALACLSYVRFSN